MIPGSPLVQSHPPTHQRAPTQLRIVPVRIAAAWPYQVHWRRIVPFRPLTVGHRRDWPLYSLWQRNL